MAFGDPPRDAYGNPQSIPPHNQIILNPDDLPVARRTKIGLGDGLLAVDDPDSDCTRISIGNGGGQLSIVSTSIGLRSFVGNLSASVLYRTRGATSVDDGGGSFWRWDPSSTATDDGVLVVKKTSVSTGRFRFVDMSAVGMYNALCAIPQTGSARSVSFDSSGSVGMGDEFWRVTKLLRDNGFAGIAFPSGVYKCLGSEQLGTSAKPMVGFDVIGANGCIFKGPAHGPNTGSVQFAIWAYCLGDTYPLPKIIQDNSVDKPHWTQTFLGYERTFTGVSDVVTDNYQPGDQVATYLGAEPTDANGWCARWQIAEVASVTRGSGVTGDITMVQPIPGPMPPTAGLNVIRTTQTFHTLKKLEGFQDNVRFLNIRFDNVFLAPIFTRNLVVDCSWDYCTFGYNAFACENTSLPNVYVKTCTGYDQGGGGAFAHYGGMFAIQSCYVTNIGSLKVENLDGVFLIDEELTSSGTCVGSADIVVNGSLAVGNHTQITTGNGGSGIEIGSLTIRGGNGFLDISSVTHIGILNLLIGDSSPITTNTLVEIRPQNVDVLFFRNRYYRTKRRGSFVIPVPLNTSKSHDFPFYGVCAGMRMRPTSLTGITALQVTDNNFGQYNLLSLSPTVNAWNDINPAATLCAMGSSSTPNITTLNITTNGSAVAGNSIEFDILYLELDSDSGQVNLNDSTMPSIVSGSGAPSVNAQYIGQTYLDTTGLLYYDSVGSGAGAGDWTARGLPLIGGGTIAGNAAFTPQITTDDYGRVTNITGLAIAIDAGQVNAGTIAYARLPAGYPVILANADFTASSINAVWTAGAYRRFEIRMDIVSGNVADPVLTLTGVSTSVYSSVNLTQTTGGAGVSTQADQTNAAGWNLTGLGQNSFIELDVFCRGTQAKQGQLRGATYGVNVTKAEGVCRVSDFSNLISGFTITFGGSTQGHYEVIGYP